MNVPCIDIIRMKPIFNLTFDYRGSFNTLPKTAL